MKVLATHQTYGIQSGLASKCQPLRINNILFELCMPNANRTLSLSGQMDTIRFKPLILWVTPIHVQCWSRNFHSKPVTHGFRVLPASWTLNSRFDVPTPTNSPRTAACMFLLWVQRKIVGTHSKFLKFLEVQALLDLPPWRRTENSLFQFTPPPFFFLHHIPQAHTHATSSNLCKWTPFTTLLARLPHNAHWNPRGAICTYLG